jgi:3-oxoacyl-[acyl-carrier protein] reductase
MDLGLAGKTALVTGGSLGIGYAIAVDLAGEGVDVVITARNSDRLAEAARSIKGPGRCVGIAGDFGSASEIDRVVEAASRAFDRPLDILINNAGSTPMGRLNETADSTWLSSLNLKLMGYMRAARAVVPQMRAQHWGRIVNIIGRSAHQPRAIYMAGGAVNAALLNFTKALADEVALDNILVTGVNPGPIDTPRLDTLFAQLAAGDRAREKKARDELAASVSLNRLGTPTEISSLVTFLCSDRSSYITGTCIDIDGGGTKCI